MSKWVSSRSSGLYWVLSDRWISRCHGRRAHFSIFTFARARDLRAKLKCQMCEVHNCGPWPLHFSFACLCFPRRESILHRAFGSCDLDRRFVVFTWTERKIKALKKCGGFTNYVLLCFTVDFTVIQTFKRDAWCFKSLLRKACLDRFVLQLRSDGAVSAGRWDEASGFDMFWPWVY